MPSGRWPPSSAWSARFTRAEAEARALSSANHALAHQGDRWLESGRTNGRPGDRRAPPGRAHEKPSPGQLRQQRRRLPARANPHRPRAGPGDAGRPRWAQARHWQALDAVGGRRAASRPFGGARAAPTGVVVAVRPSSAPDRVPAGGGRRRRHRTGIRRPGGRRPSRGRQGRPHRPGAGHHPDRQRDPRRCARAGRGHPRGREAARRADQRREHPAVATATSQLARGRLGRRGPPARRPSPPPHRGERSASGTDRRPRPRRPSSTDVGLLSASDHALRTCSRASLPGVATKLTRTELVAANAGSTPSDVPRHRCVAALAGRADLDPAASTVDLLQASRPTHCRREPPLPAAVSQLIAAARRRIPSAVRELSATSSTTCCGTAWR